MSALTSLSLTEQHESGCCYSVCGGDGDKKSSSLLQPPRKRLVMPHYQDDVVDDAAMAREMNELSVKEREYVLEEVHGVADERKESSELIQAGLTQMDACLSKLSKAKRKDLDRAIFLKPSIKTDDKFKIMFLRCDNYNPQKAAERMAKYFSAKRRLFGDSKIVKKITLEDLDETDLKMAQAGGIALRLPQPDRAGRPVMFLDISKCSFQHHSQVNRFSFHNIMSMLFDNEVAQKKGMVMILYSPSDDDMNHAKTLGRPPILSEVLQMFQETSLITNGLPFRVSSFHYAYGNALTQFFIGAIRASMGRDVRVRLRTHFGSATEIRYSLRSFGILTDGIVLAKGEEDKTPQLWQQYIDNRRELEAAEKENIALQEQRTETFAFPTENDVLIGRGRPYPEFTGNQRLMQSIYGQVDRYRTCIHLFQKRLVLKDLIKSVHDSGGKFLKRTEGVGWAIVSEEVAMEKIRKSLQRAGPGVSDETESIEPPSSKRSKLDPRIKK